MTAASGMLAVVAAGRRWRAEIRRHLEDLHRLGGEPPQPVSHDALAKLPQPVQRYFALVLPEGQPRISRARVRQAGTFRMREGGDPESDWAPFTAVQHFTAEPPGFIWDARIRMAPLTTVRVRDGYIGGHASMRGAVGGLVNVVNAADTPELRAGALQRYLAEAVWFPTALLPGRVTWSAVDESHARATLADGETSVALDFEFTPGGEIVAAHTPGRLRALPGRRGEYGLVPWGGRYAHYREQGGIRIPTEAEVFWVLEGREQPYYRGRNVRIEYRFAG
ncbi:MAG TPA: DUF6544 family protein [Gemmatimonadales bacterium]